MLARWRAARLRTVVEGRISAVIAECLYKAGFFRNCATVFMDEHELATYSKEA
jgi:hypothetical protein